MENEELKKIISDIANLSVISDFEIFASHLATIINIFELFFDNYFKKIYKSKLSEVLESD